MSQVVRSHRRGARQALRVELGAAGLHPRDPAGQRHGARRAERSRQDDAPAARGRADRAERGRGARVRPRAACGGRVGAAARRLRRPGSPAVQGLHRRRDAEARPQAQSELGRGDRAPAHRAARPSVRQEGREALGRTAGAGGAHARAREAAGAAPARRAGRLARPARPAGVPAVGDGGRRRHRHGGDPLIAHRRRPRAGLRPPRDPLAVAGPAVRLDRRGRSPRTGCSPGRAPIRRPLPACTT